MQDVYRKLSELILGGEKFAVATVIKAEGSTPQEIGAKMLIMEDSSKYGTIGGDCIEAAVITEALEAIKDSKPRLLSYDLKPEEQGGIGMICGGRMQVLVEVVQPKPILLIIGSGHIAVPLAKLGHMLGFSVAVLDPFAKKEDFPDAELVLTEHVNEGLPKIKVTPQTHIVITTRHKYDEPALRKTVHSGAAYIGLVGSRNRVRTIFQLLTQEGVANKEALKRVHAPVGLDIGAKTGEEIALSIIAEIIKVRRGGTGQPLSTAA